jgi:hypothetical protein
MTDKIQRASRFNSEFLTIDDTIIVLKSWLTKNMSDLALIYHLRNAMENNRWNFGSAGRKQVETFVDKFANDLYISNYGTSAEQEIVAASLAKQINLNDCDGKKKGGKSKIVFCRLVEKKDYKEYCVHNCLAEMKLSEMWDIVPLHETDPLPGNCDILVAKIVPVPRSTYPDENKKPAASRNGLRSFSASSASSSRCSSLAADTVAPPATIFSTDVTCLNNKNKMFEAITVYSEPIHPREEKRRGGGGNEPRDSSSSHGYVLNRHEARSSRAFCPYKSSRLHKDTLGHTTLHGNA